MSVSVRDMVAELRTNASEHSGPSNEHRHMRIGARELALDLAATGSIG